MRAVVALVILGATSTSAAEPVAMTLDEVLAAARQRPSAMAAADEAEVARAAAAVEWRRAVLPGIEFSGGVSYRDRDLTLNFGAGPLEVGDRRGIRAAAVLRQPVLDPSRLFYGARAARKSATAASKSAARTRAEASGEAADRFFDTLAIEARETAQRALVAGLQARLDEVIALAGEGRALDRDVLRIRVALDEATRGNRELALRRRVAAYALGRAVGTNNAVAPRFAAEAPAPPPVDERAAIATAIARRADLAALGASGRADQLRAKAVWAEIIPSVDVTGGWYFDDSTLAEQDHFFQASVNLVWRPLASGTRPARARAARARASATRRRAIEARRAITLAVRASVTEVAVARDAAAVAARGAAQAREAHRVTAQRFQAGRETIGDLLESEALVAERDAARRIAAVELWRAHTRLRVVGGELDR